VQKSDNTRSQLGSKRTDAVPPIDTKQVISETFSPANLWFGTAEIKSNTTESNNTETHECKWNLNIKQTKTNQHICVRIIVYNVNVVHVQNTI